MRSHIFLFGNLPRRRPPEFTAILMFEFWREATATSVPGLLCQSGRRRPENVSILSRPYFSKGEKRRPEIRLRFAGLLPFSIKVSCLLTPSSEPRGQSVCAWKLSSRLFSPPDWLPLGLRGWLTLVWFMAHPRKFTPTLHASVDIVAV